MNKKIQVKGTLPLVAEYLDADEQRVMSIFGLNLEKKEPIESKKKKGPKDDTKVTNQSKTIRTSSKSI